MHSSLNIFVHSDKTPINQIQYKSKKITKIKKDNMRNNEFLISLILPGLEI